MEALGINAGNLFVNIICFVIAFVILKHFVTAPIQKMMDKRKAVIDKGFEDAKVAAEMRESIESERQKIINEAQEESAKIIADAHKQTEQMKADYRESVEKDLSKEAAVSHENMVKERNQMLSDMRGQIVDIAVGGAKKLVDESLLGDANKQRAVINGILSGLTEGTQVDLSQIPDHVDSFGVTTAIPLNEEETKSVEKLFAGKLAKNVSITYTVEPKIIGGMIIHAGERLLDLSVNGKAQNLQKALE